MRQAIPDTRGFVRLLRQAGWEVKPTRRHLLALAPDGVTKITIGKSESDVRAMRSSLARFHKWEREWGYVGTNAHQRHP